jgi:hypothetical protein
MYRLQAGTFQASLLFCLSSVVIDHFVNPLNIFIRSKLIQDLFLVWVLFIISYNLKSGKEDKKLAIVLGLNSILDKNIIYLLQRTVVIAKPFLFHEDQIFTYVHYLQDFSCFLNIALTQFLIL